MPPPFSSKERRFYIANSSSNTNTNERNNDSQDDRIRITVSLSSPLASKFPSLSKKKNGEKNDNHENDASSRNSNSKSYNLRKRKRPQENDEIDKCGIVLSISAKISYKILLQKVASKLLADSKEENNYSYRLLLGGDYAIEDTNEIEDGDSLILDLDERKNEEAIENEEEEEEDGSENDDDEKVKCNNEQNETSMNNKSKEGPNPTDDGKEKSNHKTDDNIVTIDSDDDDDDFIEDVTDQYIKPPNYDDIEDVTQEYMAQREKERQIKLEEAEHLYDDDDDEDDEADGDDDKDIICIDDASLSTEEETETEENDDSGSSDEDKQPARKKSGKKKQTVRKKRKPKKTTPKKKASPKKKKKKKDESPPIEVIINEVDVPAAPGGESDKDEEGSNEFDSSRSVLHSKSCDNTAEDASASVKKRIIKLLNAGFHPNSNEHEAKNAMKLARRLMERYNLSQALLLREDKDEKEANNELRGGMVTVQILDRKKQTPLSCMSRWIENLITPVCDNFNVEAYKTVCRKNYYKRNGECSVTFYGILNNVQCASYAYKIAVERISAMTASYHLDLDEDGYDEEIGYKRKRKQSVAAETRSARLSYALGIVSGIRQSVREEKEQEEKRKKERLERARNAVSKGEAYEESDYDDVEVGLNGFGSGDGDDVDSDRFFNNTNDGMENDLVCTEKEGSSSVLDPPPPTTSSSAAETSAEPCNDNHLHEAPVSPVISAATASDRLERLEQEQSAALALIDHSKKIAEDVLKSHEIKVRKAARRKSLNLNRLAYDRGVEDSKEIDLNQRAIRDEESKVKNEMREKGRK